jgi:hypothetical protein
MAKLSPRKRAPAAGGSRGRKMTADARPGALPAFLDPSLARLTEKPPRGPQWVHERQEQSGIPAVAIRAGVVRLLLYWRHTGATKRNHGVIGTMSYHTDRHGPLSHPVVSVAICLVASSFASASIISAGDPSRSMRWS